MFLTPPTIEELEQSDLPDLVDMLSRQTLEYSQLLKSEGMTSRTLAIKEMVLNIQAVIDSKKDSQKLTVSK